ncbi:pescadillo [Nematocida sp. AWRm80]|nr:pescadillo [Nematocida sp. AWRm80]
MTSRYYTNIVHRRTYVTRDEAMICLGVTSEELDRWCILNDVHPYVASKGEITNRSTRIQYKLSDIHRMRESEAFQKTKLKKENKEKREKYIRQGTEYKTKYLLEDRIDYSKILLEKYPSFDDIYEDLGECITCLIICERLIRSTKYLCIDLECNLLEKIQKELNLFYLYVIYSQRRYQTFITDDGIFYLTTVNNHEVFWKEAFPLRNSEDASGINYNVIVQNSEYYSYLLEKVNFKLFKDLDPTLLPYVREIRKSNIPPQTELVSRRRLFPNEPKNKENKKTKEDKQSKSKVLPVETVLSEDESSEDSLLNGIPYDTGSFGKDNLLLEMYLASKTAKEEDSQTLPLTTGIFSSLKCYISECCNTFTNSLTMLILSNGGTIVREESESNLYLCTAVPALFKSEYNYAHPQIVYDSCNENALQDSALYRPGKDLPPHNSPFKDQLDTLSSTLDTYNISERKKEQLENLLNHRK